jgi:endonuclease G
MPSADRYLFNRQYIVGYAYIFRQARWAMELIDSDTMQTEEPELERLDNFREDARIPAVFRSTKEDYEGTGYDRGHLISSADRMQKTVVNSETFLLSNMSPQKPGFNRGIWSTLEGSVRELAKQEQYVEVYVVCGPLFNIGEPIEVIGNNKVVVPHAFFKSVLAEEGKSGRLSIWTFDIPNSEDIDADLSSFLVPTDQVESRAGLTLWDRLRGEKIDESEAKAGNMWEY